MTKAEILALIPYFFNFSVVIGILVYVGREPVRRHLYQRHELQKDLVESAARAYKVAIDRREKASSQLQHFQQEVTSMINQAEQAGSEQAADIFQNAKTDAERIKKDAARIVDNESNEQQKAIRNKVIDEAVSFTEEMLKKELKSEDHSRILKNVRNSLEAGV